MSDTTTHQTTAIDALGVTVQTGDTVTVLHHGHGVRVDDCGRRAEVIAITSNGNLRLLGASHYDEIANGRAVRPSHVAVARRDGTPGHEGNRR